MGSSVEVVIVVVVVVVVIVVVVAVVVVVVVDVVVVVFIAVQMSWSFMQKHFSLKHWIPGHTPQSQSKAQSPKICLHWLSLKQVLSTKLYCTKYLMQVFRYVRQACVSPCTQNRECVRVDTGWVTDVVRCAAVVWD